MSNILRTTPLIPHSHTLTPQVKFGLHIDLKRYCTITSLISNIESLDAIQYLRFRLRDYSRALLIDLNDLCPDSFRDSHKEQDRQHQEQDRQEINQVSQFAVGIKSFQAFFQQIKKLHLSCTQSALNHRRRGCRLQNVTDPDR